MEKTDAPLDQDSDGYSVDDGDCNDDDASIHPSAQEVCDSLDNDCDGLIDDDDDTLDGNIFYKDSDGDGYGDPIITKIACAPEDGYVDNKDDCDDTNPDIDAIDMDGDGILACHGDCDDNDGDIGTEDVDGDGFSACIDDCDDQDIHTFPGSAELDDETACMKDSDNDGFGDSSARNCVMLALIDSFGDNWSGGAHLRAIGYESGDVIESYELISFNECTQELEALGHCSMTGGGWDGTDPQGYVSFEVCARTEAISLVYTEGTSYNRENSVRVTDADGHRWEWGPNFTDASGNALPEMTTGELITIETTSVSRGTDCNDADAGIGSGDLDGDGYDACDTEDPFDCDDSNAKAHPGAAHLESNYECMRDEDEDGYGDAQPTGGITAGLDCDDGNAKAYPGAAYLESDQECMTDGDADGYGDAHPTGGATEGLDCNDLDASIHPLSVDGLTDGIDQNCDNLDGVDADGDGYADMESGGDDCDDNDPFTHPGAAELESDPSLCRTDADQDGFGLLEPQHPKVEPGTDCNDNDAFTYPGVAVFESDPSLCRTDADQDGFGQMDPQHPKVESGIDCDDANDAVGDCTTMADSMQLTDSSWGFWESIYYTIHDDSWTLVYHICFLSASIEGWIVGNGLLCPFSLSANYDCDGHLTSIHSVVEDIGCGYQVHEVIPQALTYQSGTVLTRGWRFVKDNISYRWLMGPSDYYDDGIFDIDYYWKDTDIDNYDYETDPSDIVPLNPSESWFEPQELSCSDTLDNDHDAEQDCCDSDCESLSVCSAETQCDDGIDNDCDGHVDCYDIDCHGVSTCEYQVELTCDDGINNDQDAEQDCCDSDCESLSVCSAETQCGDGIDNDCDKHSDCHDIDCNGISSCEYQVELTCDDGIDNDADGQKDCDDQDCDRLFHCEYFSELTCNDGIDNDGDGQQDCADADCVNNPSCVDDDGDGVPVYLDCDDQDSTIGSHQSIDGDEPFDLSNPIYVGSLNENNWFFETDFWFTHPGDEDAFQFSFEPFYAYGYDWEYLTCWIYSGSYWSSYPTIEIELYHNSGMVFSTHQSYFDYLPLDEGEYTFLISPTVYPNANIPSGVSCSQMNTLMCEITDYP